MANIDNGFRVEKLSLDDQVLVTSHPDDPTVGGGYESPIGSLLLRTTGDLYLKTNTADTDWTKIGSDLQQAYLNSTLPSITTTVTNGALSIADGTAAAENLIEGYDDASNLNFYVTPAGNIGVSGTVDGRDVSVDGGTLDLHVVNDSRHLTSTQNTWIDAITASSAEINFLVGTTSLVQTQLNGKQPLDSDLTALANITTTGLYVVSGTGTSVTRTLTAGTGITVTNGTGISGNPTVALATVAGTGTYGSTTLVPVFTKDAYGRVTTVTNTDIAFPVTSVNGATGAVVLTLGNISEVSLTLPTSGQTLTYNGTSWVNQTPAVVEDKLVRASATDTTSGYIGSKLVAGASVTLTPNNTGGNETITINTSIPLSNLQTEIDNIETSLGGSVSSSGVWTGFTGTNYLNGATSTTNALTLLDGVIVSNVLSRHNGGVTQTFNTTLTPLLFGTSVRNDSAYTYSTGTITINTTGNYLIQFDAGFVSTSNSITTCQTSIYKNGSQVVGSVSFSNHTSTSSGRQTASGSIVVPCTATDTLQIEAIRVAGGGSLVTQANGCRINISKLR